MLALKRKGGNCMNWKDNIKAGYKEVKLLLQKPLYDRKCVKEELGNRYLGHYLNEDTEFICPVTGKETDYVFHDSNRWGEFNSCRHCNPEKFKEIKAKAKRVNIEPGKPVKSIIGRFYDFISKEEGVKIMEIWYFDLELARHLHELFRFWESQLTYFGQPKNHCLRIAWLNVYEDLDVSERAYFENYIINLQQ